MTSQLHHHQISIGTEKIVVTLRNFKNRSNDDDVQVNTRCQGVLHTVPQPTYTPQHLRTARINRYIRTGECTTESIPHTTKPFIARCWTVHSPSARRLSVNQSGQQCISSGFTTITATLSVSVCTTPVTTLRLSLELILIERSDDVISQRWNGL